MGDPCVKDNILIITILIVVCMQQQVETDEKIWEDSLEILQGVYENSLSAPIDTYFTRIGNLIIFDIKNQLRPDIQKIVKKIFDSIYD